MRKVNVICLTKLAHGAYWVLLHAAIIVFYFIQGCRQEGRKEAVE